MVTRRHGSVADPRRSVAIESEASPSGGATLPQARVTQLAVLAPNLALTLDPTVVPNPRLLAVWHCPVTQTLDRRQGLLQSCL